MPTTPQRGYEYPDPAISPDVPYWLQRLAEQLDVDVQQVVTDLAALTSTATDHGVRLDTLEVKVGNVNDVHLGSGDVTISGGAGFATLTHGAGFTPTHVFVAQSDPAGDFAVPWGVDSFTSTTCRVRFLNAGGDGAAPDGIVPCRWLALR